MNFHKKTNTLYRMFFTILLLLTVVISCELPRDKIIDYSTLTGTITGFSRPTYMKVADNYLYVADEKGLYRINLAHIDFSGDSVSSNDLYYNNSEMSYYGSVKHFDVSGDRLFLIAYNTSNYSHSLLNIDMTASSLATGTYSYLLPNGRSANYITVCGDSLAVSGNANIVLKGYNKHDTSGDLVFDTTTDYHYAFDDKKVEDNITVLSMKPIAYQDGKKYNIFLISGDTDQMGIRKYLYDASDSSSDNIYLKSTHHTTLYPMDIQFKPNDTSTIISSETSGVVMYSITNNTNDTVTLTKTRTIGLGEDNGALKTLPFNNGSDMLACLYGYQVKPNEYDEHAYDIMAYWYGIKTISNPYNESSAKVEKTYTMEGWGTDFAIYNDKYLLVANQVKNRINIIKLD